MSVDPATRPMTTSQPVTPESVPCVDSTAAVSADSLATKPMSGGIPAIEAAEMIAATARTGVVRPRPCSWFRSRVPVPLSMMPTVKKRTDLKRAWESTSVSVAIAAALLPMPARAVIMPSWLTVP